MAVAVAIDVPVACEDKVNKLELPDEVEARGVKLIIAVPKRFVDEAFADDVTTAVEVDDIILLTVRRGESVEILEPVLDSEALVLEVDDAVVVAVVLAVIVNDCNDVIELDVVELGLGVDTRENKLDAEENADTLLLDEEEPPNTFVTTAVAEVVFVG